MNTEEVLDAASSHLETLSGHVFDVLTVSKPVSPEAAVNLGKVISKLSPLLGNLIEFNTVEFLNGIEDFSEGHWRRQDPGFPDTVFVNGPAPVPGFEIKAWFPLATEITARFKDSQDHFVDDNTRVCLLAWLPEKIIYGRPRILDVCVVSGLSVAKARDLHYHRPPDYLVIEPEDTTARTANLQQTNTNGYKFQGTVREKAEAEQFFRSLGGAATRYRPDPEYQQILRQAMGRFPYRLDTNFAKIDRIEHSGIEAFKSRVLNTRVEGKSVAQWAKLLGSDDEEQLRRVLRDTLDIKTVDPDPLLD